MRGELLMNLKKWIPSDFSGFISINSNNESLLFNAYGYRDKPNKIANNSDTIFGTASAGKAFVAIAIMKLIEENKLSIDQPVTQILSITLPNIDPTVTIKHLLNHSSGIGDYYDEDKMENYAELWLDFPNYKIRKNKDLLPLFIDKKMISSPEKTFKYNNTGYVILAMIIEELTEQSFDSYLNELIFKPANMHSTGYYSLDRLPPNTANAYIYDKKTDEYYTNIYSIDAKGTGAGGCFTTLKDLEHFWLTLFSGKIISKQTVTLMQTLQSSDCYGYGFWIAEKQGVKFPYIQGHDPGITFISSYNQTTNLNITIMSNYEQNVWKMHNELSTEIYNNSN